MTYWYLNTCIYNLQSCYEASRQNKKDKKEENLDIIKVLILLRLLLIHVIANSCKSVTLIHCYEVTIQLVFYLFWHLN